MECARMTSPAGDDLAVDRAASGDQALVDLLRLLAGREYRFISPTPATHARIVARAERQEAHDLRDVLGWSLPYRPGVLDSELERCLAAAGALEACGERRRALVRVSSIDDRLFLHSAYPTHDENAVFFGPDSYRFAGLIDDELRRIPPAGGARLVDIGTGSGVGGIVALGSHPGLRVTLTDVNPQALRYARINLRAAGLEAETLETANLDGVGGTIDLAIANPPYIVDRHQRLYRDGGGMHGGEVSLDMARQAAGRLARGGRLILYTGSAIVRGADRLRHALAGVANEHGCTLRYRELDPDVFGEELDNDCYQEVERIAVVAAVFARD